MTEPLQGGEPDKYRLNEWQQLIDERLSAPGITDALTAPDGPGLVRRPMEVQGFENVEDFIVGQNNFHKHFQKVAPGANTAYGTYYQNRGSLRRFQILFQDEYEVLEYLESTSDAAKQRWDEPTKRDHYSRLFRAYNLMSRLVDEEDYNKGDLDIVDDRTDQPNPRYLIL